MPGKPGDMGTYEMKRFNLRDTGTYRQEIPGQGDFVDTLEGRWFWIAQFNRYGSDGRTPCLLPVTWIDDWPIVGDFIRGDMVGICTYNNLNDKGYIDVDYFEYKAKNRR